jgi:hypothetical protein
MTAEQALAKPTKWLLWQALLRLDALTDKVNAMDAQTKQELLDIVTQTANLDDSVKAYVAGTNAKLDDLDAKLTAAIQAQTDLTELQNLVHTSVSDMKVSEDDALAAITANTPATP